MNTASQAPTVNDFTTGNAILPPDTPIWHSTYSSMKWVFLLSSDPLFKGDKSSMIDWDDFAASDAPAHHMKQYQYCLTEQMISELKLAAFIYANYPALLRASRGKKNKVDGKTVKGRVIELAKIGSYFITEQSKDGLVIESFADITFDMLKNHAAFIGGRPSHLKRAMKMLYHEVVIKNIGRPFSMQLADINSKSIFWGEQSSHTGIDTLSDFQFVYLLNYCKQCIAEFKFAMEMTLHDEDLLPLVRPEIRERLKKIKKPLEDYLWSENPEIAPKKFLDVYGYSAGEITRLYKEAHKASMMVILLLSGMRDSEFSLIQAVPLETLDDNKFIISKVIKHKDKDKPHRERWLVVPLTEDAHEILMYACAQTGNKQLFSSPRQIERSPNHGYTSLNTTFNRWIKSFDERGAFANHRFSVQQGRNTLAFQLAKHKVGLPFITKQLKHFYSRFSRLPNTVTAGYGNYKKELDKSIQKRIADSREEVLTDIYGEGKNFAGGGAEGHTRRIDAWFKGKGLFGEDRQNYIKKLARSNISLMPTSIGICTFNFEEAEDGSLPPPCYGDYGCDPDCDNHLISEGCAFALKDRQQHAQSKANEKGLSEHVWSGLAIQLGRHVSKFEGEPKDG
ncbi:site-specific integrase [Neiella sp. HB171785]|uniref:Site-specific integrase n=1 Tax=Neiella litorisoli TaxID=2771431 RepID=A0A8J6ULF0_9GAMM|nr:site-specific integrase [Neiella litorisoli]MBD1388860.1 site-specific integrase [Neiella litorisoli]